ncbi:Lnb N-terminal periplasmic domain-containing protein [Phyllobacterium sp. LjRoot231]|uniref:Lnb N-terminal periplasmic domain-containing protein n=1 Tax=Phyllobacterium sp. LjRoot231 TaxID=3342289 RepID=UPI003F4FB31C
MIATAWAVTALWYRLPVPQPARITAAGFFGLLGLATVVALFTRLRAWGLVVFLVSFGLLLTWWSTIRPLEQADWAPEVARQVTGTIGGDLLTLTNVRDFEWRSKTDVTERWTIRTYDLSKLQTADLFLSQWGNPHIAHVILSFGFEGGDYIAWSIEVRRHAGGQFSPIADLFKSDPLVIIAADERDVVGVRSNFRGEDVQIYRLRASPEAARALLLEYVLDANALSTSPEFYNSITTNCTTTIVKMMRAVGDVVPFDWRLIVNGYLPEYAYDRGALDTSLPLADLRERAHIDERAKAAGLSPDFARLIRVDVPTPTANQTK